VELREHERDAVTGRLILDGQDVIRELSDTKLAEELMVAAMARGHRRLDRFRELLAERDRRGRAFGSP
jgi:hypothetical protein